MLEKQNLLGLPQSKLNKFFADLGEKPYRTKQIMKWIYHQGASDFDEMHNLSKDLRQKLLTIATLELPNVVTQNHASDGVIKWVIDLGENNHIETVYIPEKDRGTLCISSQVGCALACTFCSTGFQGFNRNLKSHEIIAQVLIAHNYLVAKGKRISNVVFMGMGEPMLNESAVYDTCDLLLDDWAFGLSRRRVTISSSGVVPALYRMADTTSVSLAISLHAPDDELRDVLVPINKKYPIKQLMEACQYYLNAGTQERHILFEYVMLDGVNDSEAHAKKLAKLLQGVSAKVNLIPFNPFPETQYKTSKEVTINQFQDILFKSGIRTTTRRTRGEDVDAACGQLAGKVQDKSRRNVRRD
ncbi:MAG TPA: 23S rRNA (adenine(2503)-C(2))-methyltransferase RlmN [Candidatus Thioglobus sp.]|jgi:23S rRNA (adenine2503-C2)-methyltransferase|nr:23S rRNA (adenine(2503)-C(2))-methyltransferase RlmN [Candidatus Thioglobus sp.]HIL20520.1 23S rRNA (adenine(2503)-C(2))-methyltransferase RlmN [Candidatus Thioglobus sp.]